MDTTINYKVIDGKYGKRYKCLEFQDGGFPCGYDTPHLVGRGGILEHHKGSHADAGTDGLGSTLFDKDDKPIKSRIILNEVDI